MSSTDQPGRRSRDPKRTPAARHRPELSNPDGLDENPAPVIRDKRKVDPETGQPRVAAEFDGSELDHLVEQVLGDEVIAAAEVIAARAELDSRTEDLQRLSAEYANYRKRVERDRDQAGLAGQAQVLTALIPVLDDIEAARTAGELDGPFGAVSTKLEAALAKFGMARYGAEGDQFDPAIHEALMHQTSPEMDGPTITMVVQPGYRMAERVLRAARVGVTDSEG